jgi:GntR family transcriptional regulator, vanillate catabolism transcriptional regulator
MASQVTRVLLGLRERIFSGALKPGERLAEIPLAEALGASRTPVRLALAELEREGLVVAVPSGGFAVRGFTVREIEDAIALRGTLEGMAARLVAEHGVSRRLARELADCLEAGDAAVAEGSEQAYAEMNARFHAAIVEASENAALIRALAQVSALPFASASALVADARSAAPRRALLAQAQHQHHLLVEALRAGQGARAEALAREHAENARRNLRLILDSDAPPASVAQLLALRDSA